MRTVLALPRCESFYSLPKEVYPRPHSDFIFFLINVDPIDQRKVYGITYSSEQGLLGGWGEYIYLKPGVKILRLPQSVTPEIYISGTENYVYLFLLRFFAS